MSAMLEVDVASFGDDRSLAEEIISVATERDFVRCGRVLCGLAPQRVDDGFGDVSWARAEVDVAQNNEPHVSIGQEHCHLREAVDEPWMEGDALSLQGRDEPAEAVAEL